MNVYERIFTNLDEKMSMNITEKLAEIKSHFSEKILNREFELLYVTEYVAKIQLGEEYSLEVWLGDNLSILEPHWHFDFQREVYNSIFPHEFSQDEKDVLRGVIQSYYDMEVTAHDIEEKILEEVRGLETIEEKSEILDNIKRSKLN